MEIKGTVKQILPVQSGEGRNGTWRKQEFILEIPGQYPKSICMHMWGDAIEASDLKLNEEIVASIDIESREYNGRWYTNIRAWRITREAPSSEGDAPSAEENWPTPNDEVKTESAAEEFDDLPF